MPLDVTQNKYEKVQTLSRRSSISLCNRHQIDFYNDIGTENIYAISIKRTGGFNFLMNVLACRRSTKPKKKSHFNMFQKRGKGKDKTLVFITSILDVINHWCSWRSYWCDLFTNSIFYL